MPKKSVQDRDSLTDPNGKSLSYQANAPKLAKRMDKVMKNATKSLSKAVSTIIGDLYQSYTFGNKQSAYNWLQKTPNMASVKALLEMVKGIQDEAKRKKYLKKINAGAKIYRASRMEALNEAIKINKEVIKDGVIRNVAPILYGVAQDAFSRQTYTLQKQVGLGWMLDVPPGAQIVKGMNSTLDKMAEWYHGPLDDEIRDKVVEGVMVGKSGAEIGRDLQRMGMPSVRAKAVAKTMLTTISNEAELEALNNSSVKKYEYVATLDERTCPVCGRMDGKVFPLDKAKAGVNFPPMHPNCRCVHIAALTDDVKSDLTRFARDSEGKRISVPASMTYEQWRRKYLVQTPRKAPGKPQAVTPKAKSPATPVKPKRAQKPKQEAPKQTPRAEPAIVIPKEEVKAPLQEQIERVMDTKKYWTTGSIKVSTPEEVEDLKKRTFKAMSWSELDELSESQVKQIAKDRADMIRSVPTPAEMEGVSEDLIDDWLNPSRSGKRNTPQDSEYWIENWTDKLTMAETEAIEEYTGSLYQVINPPMYTYGESIVSPRRFMAINVKQYEAIDSAIAKAENKTEIIAKRGMNGSPFKDLKEITDADVGKSYTVPNYFSTSTGGDEFSGEYTLHILIPKGKGIGAYVDPISKNQGETEFLIKRNARYLIEKVSDNGRKKHVWLRVVG